LVDAKITNTTLRQFGEHVGSQQHAMAGAVIAANAAQAAALGEACVRVSRAELHDQEAVAAAETAIATMSAAKEELFVLCDRDAATIGAFVAAGRELGSSFATRDALCALPAEIGRLASDAGLALQAFRPRVAALVHDDLEMALVLLTGAMRAAILLVDSNLRIWPEPALLEKYEPALVQLEERFATLQPVARLR
jgi:formiminotetrahydrofolate cyclodeaminase